MEGFVIWTTAALAHTPVLHEVHPDMDWCAFVNGQVENNGLFFDPGDVALFQPGTYTGACDFTARTTEETDEVTILQSADVDRPARFEHDGASPFVWRVTGTAFFLVGFDFGPIPAGASAVHLQDASEGWVRYAHLERVDGTAVSLGGACTGLDVLDVRVVTGDGIGIDAACTSGTGLNVAGNWLTLDDGAILRGAEVTVADNTFEGARPLLLEGPAVVERNLFVDAESAVRHDGGDLLFRGNIVEGTSVGTFGAGQIAILGNTLRAALDVPADARVQANALDGQGVEGNIRCDDACYTAPDQRDLYPGPSSALRSIEALPEDIGLDFCKQERTEPVAGALTLDDDPPGPIPVGFKSDLPCTFAELPQRETPEARPDEVVPSRGCSTAPSGLFLAFLVPFFLRPRSGGLSCS